MSTEGSVGPEGSLEVEVIHKDGSTQPVAVNPITNVINKISNWWKGLNS